MFRWLILAVLLSALTVSGYHRARARLGGETVPRRREGSLFLTLRGLMALAVFGGILAHAVRPRWMAWASFEVPEALRWFGLVLGVLTVPAVHWVLSALGRNVTETVLTKECHELVTGGPYRWVRHPLYTTGLILLLALALMAGSWFVLLGTGLAFVLLRTLVIPREEQALLAKFGERYRAYMRRTGRLVPRLRAAPRPDRGRQTARGSEMEIRSVKQFLEYWANLRERTRRVVLCIPPERLEWTYREGAFTFGDVIRHLAAIERYMYAETVAGRPSRYPGCGRELADGYEAVLAYADRLDQQARGIIGGLEDADLARKCRTPAGTAITTWKWLRAMCEHEAHHRGQIYLMLNMLEVATPPLFGLTSEEVRARSA